MVKYVIISCIVVVYGDILELGMNSDMYQKRIRFSTKEDVSVQTTATLTELGLLTEVSIDREIYFIA